VKWRLVVASIACLAAGFAINAGVAAVLGLRPSSGVFNQGFGFTTGRGMPYNMQWSGDFGRDAIASWSTHSSGPFAPAFGDLRDTFQSVFAPEAGHALPNYRLWRARLFPGWFGWTFQPPPNGRMRVVYASGWPMRSAYGIGNGAAVVTGSNNCRGIIVRDPTPSPRALGWFLLPVGTTVNTLFYAIPFAVIVFGIPVARRRRRFRLGRCMRCGYDLGGDFANGCPECGWNRPGGESVSSAI
jgi:hypothetical protein